MELGVKNLGSGTKVVKVKSESKWNVLKSGLITKKNNGLGVKGPRFGEIIRDLRKRPRRL